VHKPQRQEPTMNRFALLLKCSMLAFAMLAGSAAMAQGIAQGMAANAPQWQAAADKLNASVVGIEVTATRGARSAATLGRAREGTAVVIDDDGTALTIGYLILEAETLDIVTPQGKKFPGRVVAYDLASGFGLVAPLIPMNVPKVALGNSAELKDRDLLIVSTGGEDGEYGLTQLVSQRKFSGYWEYHLEQALFTHPPIQKHGGAGVFNMAGELVGIGSLYVGDSAGVREGLNSEAPSVRPRPGNMYVPIDLLKPILSELRSKGHSRASVRPWLGVSSVEREGKITVARVNPDSPAAQAGLRVGDAILQIDGQPVKQLENFYKALWQRAQPEGTVNLVVEQSGEIRTLQVQSVDRMKVLTQPQGV
jgi:serine protease Do